MASLGSLKVDSAPAAFAPTARAHNALVNLIESMQGQNGVKVSISEGRILIELEKKAGLTTNSGGGGGGGAIANANTTATELHYTSTFQKIDIDGSGIINQNPFAHDYISMSFGQFFQQSGTTLKTITINGSDITHDMALREVDVCDSGVAKKMLILASAPY